MHVVGDDQHRSYGCRLGQQAQYGQAHLIDAGLGLFRKAQRAGQGVALLDKQRAQARPDRVGFPSEQRHGPDTPSSTYVGWRVLCGGW
ncbi:hypothetical protein GCM10010404_92240 [Nonomuraea africana]